MECKYISAGDDAPSLETGLTSTSPPPTGPVCGGPLVHGGLRHPQYFYQDGPGPGAGGLAVSWLVFFSLYFLSSLLLFLSEENTYSEAGPADDIIPAGWRSWFPSRRTAWLVLQVGSTATAAVRTRTPETILAGDPSCLSTRGSRGPGLSAASRRRGSSSSQRNWTWNSSSP